MTATITHPSTNSIAAEPTTRGRYVRAGLASGALAAAVVVTLATVADAVGVSFEVDGESIPLAGFAQVTFMSVLIGIGLAAVFSRKARRPRHTFVVTTVVLTAISLAPPVMIGLAVSGTLTLELLHLAAAAIVIPAIAARLAD